MSMKQLRAVIFDNGTPKAKEYGDKLFEEIGSMMETHQVNVYDTRPCTQVLPVRAIPNVAVLFYADTLEEGQTILEVASQLDFFRRQEEAQAAGARLLQDGVEAGTVDGTQVVASMILLPLYKAEGPNGDYNHTLGECCTYNGQPWKCCQGYNAQNNPDILPGSSPAQWAPFHSSDPATALPFVQPTGAHDAYQKGECCIWTDGLVYRSIMEGANAYSPEAYPAGWELVDGSTTQLPDTEEPGTEGPEIPAFVQPTGAHDAYQTGDMVTYNGKVYRSLIDNNAYSPDAYPQGWEVVS